MTTLSLGQAERDSLFEGREGVVVLGIKTLLLDEFPESLNQIKIGRVRRQEKELDVERVRQAHDKPTILISRIVHDQSDRAIRKCLANLVQQLSHGRSIDIVVIGNGDELVSDRV